MRALRWRAVVDGFYLLLWYGRSLALAEEVGHVAQRRCVSFLIQACVLVGLY